MFIRNLWYVAAWEHEISADGLFSRTIIGIPIVFYRDDAGRVVALEDRCCHRHAPLSRGRKEGSCVRCGYHGLKFDASGRCVEIPGTPGIPRVARVRAFPTVVHHRWVVVWMGETSPDHSSLPDNFSCDHPDWKYLPGYLRYDTPYPLIVDNLLDFSHLSYVHAQTLGGSEEIARIHPKVDPIEGGVRVERTVPSVPMPNYYAPLWEYTGLIDRWISYEFRLPATLLMASGARPAGAAASADGEGVLFHSCQALTPETPNSTHYFFMEAHRADSGDASTTAGLFDGLLAAFEEDRKMITAQAGNVSSATPMVALPMDKALVLFRRITEERLRAEQPTTTRVDPV